MKLEPSCSTPIREASGRRNRDQNRMKLEQVILHPYSRNRDQNRMKLEPLPTIYQISRLLGASKSRSEQDEIGAATCSEQPNNGSRRRNRDQNRMKLERFAEQTVAVGAVMSKSRSEQDEIGASSGWSTTPRAIASGSEQDEIGAGSRS